MLVLQNFKNCDGVLNYNFCGFLHSPIHANCAPQFVGFETQSFA